MSRHQMLLTLGLTAALLLLVAKIWLWWGELTLPPLAFTPAALGSGLLLGAVITLFGEGLYRLWPGFREAVEQYMNLVVKPLDWADVLWLGLLPGMSEELVFRGVALVAFGPTWESVLVTSLIFGILHLLDLRYWSYGVWASVIGFSLGTSYLLTGNLLVPVIAHVTANLIAGFRWKRRLMEPQS